MFKLSEPISGSGIHIHIEDSVLSALLDRVPWVDVLESLNNKLSKTEETKHIREHIYKTAGEKNLFDHHRWHHWKQSGHNFNAYQQQQRTLPINCPSRYRQRMTYQEWLKYCGKI